MVSAAEFSRLFSNYMGKTLENSLTSIKRDNCGSNWLRTKPLGQDMSFVHFPALEWLKGAIFLKKIGFGGLQLIDKRG